MKSNLIIIGGMMIVTYIPRLIPFVLVSGKEMPGKLRRFFTFVPYTALGALIVPGAFQATPEFPAAAAAGIVTAALLSWFFRGILVPVFGSIAVVYFMILSKSGFAF